MFSELFVLPTSPCSPSCLFYRLSTITAVCSNNCLSYQIIVHIDCSSCLFYQFLFSNLFVLPTVNYHSCLFHRLFVLPNNFLFPSCLFYQLLFSELFVLPIFRSPSCLFYQFLSSELFVLQTLFSLLTICLLYLITVHIICSSCLFYHFCSSNCSFYKLSVLQAVYFTNCQLSQLLFYLLFVLPNNCSISLACSINAQLY